MSNHHFVANLEDTFVSNNLLLFDNYMFAGSELRDFSHFLFFKTSQILNVLLLHIVKLFNVLLLHGCVLMFHQLDLLLVINMDVIYSERVFALCKFELFQADL